MLKWLKPKRRLNAGASVSQSHNDGWMIPRPGAELLDTPYRKQLVKTLWEMTALTKDVFDEYIRQPLTNYADLVQLLPASESHHHSYQGGMLDHGLEIACYALKLRRQHLLPPGAKPEEQASIGEVWSAAVVYAAIMHDAAKVLVDIDVYTKSGKTWRLWHGNIPEPYQIRYRPGRDYHLHEAINPIICDRVLGPAPLDWLYSSPEVFTLMMYTISGHPERAGIIGEIVNQADQSSVAKALGGNPSQAFKAPVESLQRKLADGLRFLVKERLSLNVQGAPAFLTDEALWLVAPRVPRDLKSHLLESGVTGVPTNDTRLYDEMQAHSLILPNPEGKSIWKATVSLGEWETTLSLLKVSPSLIWGKEERPESLQGSIVVSNKGEKSANSEEESQDTTSRPPGNHNDQKEVKTTPDRTAPSTPGKEDSAQHVQADNDMDEMIALLAGDDGAPAEENEPSRKKQNDQTPQSDTQTEEKTSPKKNKASNNGPDLQPESSNEDLGHQFMSWLDSGLTSCKLPVNDAKAAVHVVDGTYFLVSPNIFKKFCASELGDDKRWEEVQTRFQKLGVHHKTADYLNIFKVSVVGPNKKSSVLKGYLLKDISAISRETPTNNVFLTLKTDKEA